MEMGNRVKNNDSDDDGFEELRIELAEDILHTGGNTV